MPPSCAIRKAGLFCWGQNFAGELGTGDTTASMAPVKATVAGKDVVDVATNSGRTCVRRSSGEVACWGKNDQGQIGDGTRDESLVPVAASGIEDAIGMAIDDMSTCVLRRDHTVACWGMSPESMPTRGSLTPIDMLGLEDIVELRNGMMGSYCARDMQAHVWCWRVKDGAWTAPEDLQAVSGARAIALGAWDEVCVIGREGAILCHNFDSGKTIPLERSQNSVAVVGAGGLAACGQHENGSWQCWNVLPPMLETIGSKPIEVRSSVPIRDLEMGGFRVCGLRDNDSVACVDAGETISIVPPPEFAELPEVEGLPL
ncbi:MAG TPA: hypothetical protein VFN67_15350 [Polyangiales bacterium]|nr:hypothetical protein [Polyangiales bacterium]